MIFAGVIGREVPAGVSQSAVVAHLRQSGQGTLANLVQSTPITHGVDFDHLGQILLQVLLVYLAASVASYFQGRLTAMVGQRSVARLRGKVQSKLTRLPLSYFDRQPRGEILSPRHERHRQHLPDAAADAQPDGHVAPHHRRRARCDVHHLLAAGVDRARHRTAVDLRRHQDRKAGAAHFVDQWRTTGQLNGHIEEMYTGHSLVKLFGRRHEAEAVFRQHNESLYQSSFKAQFVSGLIQPAMTLIGNINYVFVAVIGGLQVASGQLSLGAVQAFIQYSRQFSQPISQVASMANMLQSGVASAERVFALLDADRTGA